MKVPFVNLKAQHDEVNVEIKNAINTVIESTAFSSGKFVEIFENDFSNYISTKHCIAVNSGTSALHLALRALDIKEGDEVITVPNTFIATVWAISYVGAKPVFVDIEPDYYTINPELIEQAISSKTKAIIPVHLYGHPANMDAINDIAKKYGLYVIEDSAQAQGAEYNNHKCGSMSDIACFSFYPSKNLGAYGEAGALTTNNDTLAQKIHELRNHAQNKRYFHNDIGYNYRMDGIQGAVLSVHLKYLDARNNSRIVAAKKYSELLKENTYIKTPQKAGYAKHIYHLYEIFLIDENTRNKLIEYLQSKEIGCGLHYPVPVHLQEVYTKLGYGKGSFPYSENSASCLLSLPMFPHITESMLEYVCNSINEFFHKSETNN